MKEQNDKSKFKNPSHIHKVDIWYWGFTRLLPVPACRQARRFNIRFLAFGFWALFGVFV
jgi:hypothetical protein